MKGFSYDGWNNRFHIGASPPLRLHNAFRRKNKGGGSSTFFVGGPDSSHGHHLSGGDSFGDGDGGGGDCGGLSPSSAPARIFRLDAVLLQSAGHVPAISLHTFSIYSKQSIQLFNRTSDWE
ncbi:hypothetical protein QKW52_10330 [Bacillus sonorensis]|nr:hypothetical protein [Bacillus sonorensis]